MRYPSSAPTKYDSGYATFGGDAYTYMANNAAEAASAARTVAGNQQDIFGLMQTVSGILLIGFGLLGFCHFGALKAAAPMVAPMPTPAPVAAPAPMAREAGYEAPQAPQAPQQPQAQEAPQQPPMQPQVRPEEAPAMPPFGPSPLAEPQPQAEPPKPQAADERWVCPICGATNAGFAGFCTQCGVKRA